MKEKDDNISTDQLADTTPEEDLNQYLPDMGPAEPEMGVLDTDTDMDMDKENKDDITNELPIPGDAYPIKITPDTVFFVDPTDGNILGPKAEGTLGIILYGERADTQSARAIRIPRLLSSDTLLNFHIAEISNYEGVQAAQFSSDPGLLGALSFFRLSIPNNYTHIPGHDGNAFLGFYLSPASQYKACMISRDRAWPDDFASYLKAVDKKPGELFENIASNARGKSRHKGRNLQSLNNLIFIPHLGDRNKNIDGNLPGYSKIGDPIVLSREKLHLTSRERNVSGWWFNLPIAVYSWMTADLQRLLTAGVDGGEELLNEIDRLKEWKLIDWFRMFKILAVGFYCLHTKGAVHGDPRPANIMIDIPPRGKILPDSFRWIDIGLGYETTGIDTDEKGQTSVTPRPLGGSRTSPFYAPERVEGKELEDADHIKLTKKENNLLLTFYFRQKTDQKPRPLRLKEKREPVRELGTLHEGDRIQVREFLFTIKEVREFDIVVSKIYEIVLDRVLIDKTIDVESGIILDILKSASISRYRIFKQWSQATDIYGLGNTILYTIFMRGFFKKDTSPPGVKKNVKEGGSVKEVEPPAAVIYNRSPGESIFMGLSQTLRSKTFLVQILKKLAESGFVQKESIWQQEILDATYVESKHRKPDADKDISKIISNIYDQISAFNYNFDYVLRGLNGRIGLLVQLTYFCLCCVWREDEWDEIKLSKSNTFGIMPIFQPFCKSRLKIPGDGYQGLPAERAKEYLQILINNISKMSDSFIDGPVTSERTFSDSKDEQISKLITKNEDLLKNLEQEKEKSTKEKSLLQNQIRDKEEENLRLRKRNSILERKKSDNEGEKQRVEKLLSTIEVLTRSYFEERRRSIILNSSLIKKKIRHAEKYIHDILYLIKKERRQKNI